MTIYFENFGDELKYESLRVEVLTILRRSFTDITGVAAVGLTTPLSKIARRVAPMIFGSGTEGTLRMMMDGTAFSPEVPPWLVISRLTVLIPTMVQRPAKATLGQ